MKIKVSIKNDEFSYSYKIGESSHTSISKITPELLICFTNILNVLTKAACASHDKRLEEIKKEAYVREANKPVEVETK